MRIGRYTPCQDAHLAWLSRVVCFSNESWRLFKLAMKQIFNIGNSQVFRRVVENGDTAAFQGAVVHPVCATFALARDIEWTTRQFVLQMREDDEDGVGTMLTINHVNPAFVGDEITYSAQIEEINGNELICSYEARVGDRLIASGKTGQKVLKREKINRLFRI